MVFSPRFSLANATHHKFKTHYKRHIDMVWKCLLCSFTALVLNLLLSHYNSKHVNDPHFQVNCGINVCPNTYTKANSFAAHVRRRHREYLYCTSEEVPVGPWPIFSGMQVRFVITLEFTSAKSIRT